ncbi:hypothetical protein L2E82_32624 [Cichorium intybus]|uniref:Uncharacterized protein n=1 Tax=Cichorium intybus TaxID=13427 RepID=A0ACB9BIR7_CICIN|nr:hypothetical protein L2E82_32624 [Cichorium intybus]
MEQIALDYEILKQENHDISYKLEQSQLQEQLKMQYECSTPSLTMPMTEYQSAAYLRISRSSLLITKVITKRPQNATRDIIKQLIQEHHNARLTL